MFAKRRMNRIFKPDGRTLIVAMDHVGFENKPLPGLINADAAIVKCVSAGADAVMTTPGTAQSCMNAFGDAAFIMTIPTAERPAIDNAVENALRLGADAVKVLVYPFEHHPESTVLNLTWLGAECAAWGMPLLAETIPGGWAGGDDMRTPDALAAAARIGAECGADFIKTMATSDPADFQIVADNSPVPVVILGGAKADNDRALLESIKIALDNGAAGVAMGRNLWGHPSPERITAAVASLIHGNASVDEALKEMS